MFSKINFDNRLIDFTYLPHFIRFVLDNYLEEYVATQIRSARELELPLLQFLSHMTEEELFAFSIIQSRKFLLLMAENKAGEQVENSLREWKNNQLPFVEMKDITVDDVFLVSHLRKKTLQGLIKYYTGNLTLAFQIIEEMDRFFLVHDSRATNTYLQLLNNKIEEVSHFKDKLTTTTPGFY